MSPAPSEGRSQDDSYVVAGTATTINDDDSLSVQAVRRVPLPTAVEDNEPNCLLPSPTAAIHAAPDPIPILNAPDEIDENDVGSYPAAEHPDLTNSVRYTQNVQSIRCCGGCCVCSICGCCRALSRPKDACLCTTDCFQTERQSRYLYPNGFLAVLVAQVCLAGACMILTVTIFDCRWLDVPTVGMIPFLSPSFGMKPRELLQARTHLGLFFLEHPKGDHQCMLQKPSLFQIQRYLNWTTSYVSLGGDQYVSLDDLVENDDDVFGDDSDSDIEFGIFHNAYIQFMTPGWDHIYQLFLISSLLTCTVLVGVGTMTFCSHSKVVRWTWAVLLILGVVPVQTIMMATIIGNADRVCHLQGTNEDRLAGVGWNTTTLDFFNLTLHETVSALEDGDDTCEWGRTLYQRLAALPLLILSGLLLGVGTRNYYPGMGRLERPNRKIDLSENEEVEHECTIGKDDVNLQERAHATLPESTIARVPSGQPLRHSSGTTESAGSTFHQRHQSQGDGVGDALEVPITPDMIKALMGGASADALTHPV